MRGTVFLPFPGEFGFFVIEHLRFVNAYDTPYKVVVCRRGEECFFPEADEFVYQSWDFLADANKAGACAWVYTHSSEGINLRKKLERRFPGFEVVWTPVQDVWSPVVQKKIISQRVKIRPLIRRGLKVDVVICCRKRRRGQSRNYRHWGKVVSALVKKGYSVGVVGQEKTSYCPRGVSVRSWDYSDSNAAIEMLQNCKLYIGTDTGVSHLAVMMSVPMVVFHRKWKLSLHTLIKAATKGPVKILGNGRTSPDSILKSALRFLRKTGRKP